MKNLKNKFNSKTGDIKARLRISTKFMQGVLKYSNKNPVECNIELEIIHRDIKKLKIQIVFLWYTYLQVYPNNTAQRLY